MLSSDTGEPCSYQITADKALLYERIMPAKNFSFVSVNENRRKNR